ncbi:MAG: prolyl oligopeptidase family serine peptidase [Candidatus Latescibacteria bacterium]|nr:prolyl oligopeptidase family serine peptidase [Candidatus Latescibacterota bacterium]
MSDPQGLPTLQSLWSDFDPHAGPLEEEILATYTKDGADYKEIYFSAFVNGEKVRIYGIYAAPAQAGNYPALLHMHGGGQTVAPHWLKTWSGRGYAILSINCHGVWPERPRYTLYPDALSQGNHRMAGSMRQATEPSLKACSWYIWAAVNRRALTYLGAQTQVDAERLGIFGISMGGTSVWHVALDQRVKAACAIYGVGWNEHELYAEKFNQDKHRPKPSLAQRIWEAGMAPQAYSPHIHCPMLFLSAANDQHGNLDYVFDTMTRLPSQVPWRVAITPRFRHHIGRAEGKDLLLWMDTWLRGDGPDWPQTPTAALSLGADGVPRLEMTVDDSGPIERIDVYYNVGNSQNKTRHWRQVAPEGSAQVWRAPLPTSDIEQNLVAFANIYYQNGLALTAPLVAAIPARLGAARATGQKSRQIYSGEMGLDGWTTESPGTDPNPPIPLPLRLQEGPGGRAGVALQNRYRKLLTYKIGDPDWRGPNGAQLGFKVYAEQAQQIAAKVADQVVSHQAKDYLAAVELTGQGDWQQVLLAAEAFATAEGDTLAGWEDLAALWILPADGKAFAKGALIFSDFEWI